MTNALVTVQSNLKSLIESKRDALPKGFNETRFIQNCMVVLNDVNNIEKMQPLSVARTMLKGAFLGLDFFNKECYAIPYGNRLNFQTDYKGEKKLAKKYSVNPINDIYAKVVREGDDFEERIERGQQIINFTPKPFNDGEIIGVFAVVYFKDGSMQYETMSKKEVEEIRDKFSKQKTGDAWGKSFGEMAKKTVLRRLCKHIELDFDTIEMKKTFDDVADSEFNNNDDLSAGSSSIDIDAEEIQKEEGAEDGGNSETESQ